MTVSRVMQDPFEMYASYMELVNPYNILEKKEKNFELMRLKDDV